MRARPRRKRPHLRHQRSGEALEGERGEGGQRAEVAAQAAEEGEQRSEQGGVREEEGDEVKGEHEAGEVVVVVGAAWGFSCEDQSGEIGEGRTR